MKNLTENSFIHNFVIKEKSMYNRSSTVCCCQILKRVVYIVNVDIQLVAYIGISLSHVWQPIFHHVDTVAHIVQLTVKWHLFAHLNYTSL